MTQRAITLNRRITKNVGDLASGPLQYFPEYADGYQVEVLGWNHREAGERKKWWDRVNAADLVVVGGGGLLEWDKYRTSLDMVRSMNKKAVIWGAGYNVTQLTDWLSIKPPYVGDYSRFDLVGIRDYGHQYEWVPDASCLSPLFDKPREITREFVFQANRGSTDHVHYMPEGVPEKDVIGNIRMTMAEVLDAFGSAETVITQSFHGAYWATLLGRKVVAIPMSSKAYSMKHPLPLAHASDWRRYVQLARTYPEALEDCRAVNRAFAERVFNL